MTTNDIPVLIVGAGPTGLMLANVLAQADVAFRIIDGKSGPVVESRAVVMHAKTIELLARLGLDAEALAAGERVGSIAMHREGRRVGEASFFAADLKGSTPFPFALIHEQSKTERLLLTGLDARGHTVDWSTTLQSLTRRDEGVHVIVRRPDGRDEAIEARWVVGADGAHSLVRRALGLTLVGDTYEQTLFLADIDLAWDLPDGQAQAEITPSGFLLYFPMHGNQRYRLLGTLPPRLEHAETVDPETIQGILDQSSALGPRITATRWTSVYRTHHRMVDRFRVGRVFLAGDAAHIHSPAGGQGMNTGMGDAFNLGWKLALMVRGEAHERLLDSYDAERVPFARAILNGSDRGFKLVDTTDRTTQHAKLMALPPLFSVISRVPPVRDRLFWFISQLWTRYRESPAVAEAEPVGRLPRAGDRAPDGLFQTGDAAGVSLFTQLACPRHALLLFAGRRPNSAVFAAAAEVLSGLLLSYRAPINMLCIPAGNTMLEERYGADVPSIVLVRPDGHIGFRGDATDIIPLTRYLDQFFTHRAVWEVEDRLSGADRIAS